jgi:hypothetical protein
MLMENLEVELVGPPIAIPVCAVSTRDRAFAFVWHGFLRSCLASCRCLGDHDNGAPAATAINL